MYTTMSEQNAHDAKEKKTHDQKQLYRTHTAYMFYLSKCNSLTRPMVQSRSSLSV